MDSNQEINEEQNLPYEIANLHLNISTQQCDDNKSETTATDVCSAEFARSCSSCCPSGMTGGSCCAIAIVDKLLDKLKASEEKCANLEKSEKLLTEKAVKAEAELMSMEHKIRYQELDIQHLLRLLWKAFPSPHQPYLIRFANRDLSGSDLFFNACSDGSLGVSKPVSNTNDFKLSKNSDGTYAIFSPSLFKFLTYAQPDSYFGKLAFSSYTCDQKEAKFNIVFEKETATKQHGFVYIAGSIKLPNTDYFVKLRSVDEVEIGIFPFNDAKKFNILPCSWHSLKEVQRTEVKNQKKNESRGGKV